jgi:sugar lactone lactonase YvrE
MPGVEVFAKQNDVTGESPLWRADEGALYWLDIGRKNLHRKDVTGDASSWSLPDYPGCIAEFEAQAVAIALGSGVHRFDLETGAVELLCAAPRKRPRTRFNDGKVDPTGRFWASTMQNNFGPRGEQVRLERWDGSLFRFDSNGTVDTIEENLGCGNTLAWSPDLKRFYFADSLKNQIYLYDFEAETGSVRNRRVFFEVADLGVPDGSAMDCDGCLWNVRCDAGVILRITPNGEIDRRIELPVPRPTSCIFGGRDLDILFVTSARRGLDAGDLDRAPLSGSVFAIAGMGQGLPVPAMHWTRNRVARSMIGEIT